MKIIEELYEHIDEEIHDMKCYAKMACLYKGKYPQLAETLSKISVQEETHASALHDKVVELIDAYKKAGNSIPVDMEALYEYLHKRQIEKHAEALRYLDMYKENH